jgi:site-specific recombinase XerD
VFVFGFGKSQLAHGIPGKWLIESPDYGKVGEFFRGSLKRSGIKLPKGQSTHVLRHTFASHFMMNGGNILTLQKILGHSSVIMTMRYAHLSPDHLKEALLLNPLHKLII